MRIETQAGARGFQRFSRQSDRLKPSRRPQRLKGGSRDG